MQASKIVPGAVYAIMRNGQLVRFRAEAVTTTRYKATGSPHDYKSTVRGTIAEDGANGLSNTAEEIELDPKSLLGPYAEHAELMARKKAEDDAKKAAADARTAKAVELVRVLYGFMNIPVPDDVTSRSYRDKAAIHVGYSDSVEIDFSAVEDLLDALTEQRVVADFLKESVTSS